MLLALGLAGSSACEPSIDGKDEDVNPYSPAYEHPYRHGVVPTPEAHARMTAWRTDVDGTAGGATATAAITSAQTLSFGGGVAGVGVTSGTPKVYLVFYGSQWGTPGTDANGNLMLSGDPNGAGPYLQQMFKGLGTGGELWSGVMTQYCDGPQVATGATTCPGAAPHVGYPSGTTLAGVWYDNSVASPAQATIAQLAAEAVNAAAHFGNTTTASNRYVQYVVLSPTGTHPDGFGPSGGFCAWHSYTASSFGNVAYTNLPYVNDIGCGMNFVNSGAPGLLDGFSIVEGHEYAETVTDQFPAGGWSAGQTQENADECAWIRSGQGALANVAMGTGTFAMQSTWSNDTNRCDMSHPVVLAQTPQVLSANPSSVSLSTSGGQIVTATVRITNAGATSASAIQVAVSSVSGTTGFLSLGSNLCSGQTLAPGGSCTFNVEFESGCSFQNLVSKWNLNISAAGAANAVVVPVTGTTLKGICR